MGNDKKTKSNDHLSKIGGMAAKLLKFKSKSLKDEKKDDEKEYISWFLLTSACLSKGAQGYVTPNRIFGSNSTSYKNFELGVLFCSRLCGDKKTDRLYVS